MSKERKLLERALEQADYIYFVTCEADTLAEEIRDYLAQPEKKREALSDRDMFDAYYAMHFDKKDIGPKIWASAVRFAERHHGIGGKDEQRT